MAAKNIFIILIVTLMAAPVAIVGNAVENGDHFNLCKLKSIYMALAPSIKDITLKPTVQLMKMIMFDLQSLGLNYAKRAKDVSDNMLKDPLITTSKSPEVVKFKQHIEEYVTKYATCSDMEELFDLVDFYSNASLPYYEMEKEGTLTGDAKIVLEVLKKYSPKDLDSEFEQEFLNKFVTKIGYKINEVRENLKNEEGGMGIKILQWWDKTKALKTTEEKMEAFKEYMKLYGMDDE